MFRNRLLGGVSFLPMIMREGEGVAGGGAAAAAPAAAAAAAAPAKVEGGAAAAPAAAAAAAPAAAAADAGGTKAPAGTLASGAETPAAAAAAAKTPANFPDNWRQLIAGDDKAQLAQLERLGSPAEVWKAYRELQAKVSAGELKAAPQPLAKDAKPEEVAAWRKQNGIPEKPEEYKIELANGMVVGEADKPLVDNFVKYAHGQNLPPAVVNQTLNWYYQMQDALVAQRLEADEGFHTDSTVALKQEWGPDFKGNINAVTSVLNMFPEDFRAQVEHARTPDGQKLGDTPAFNKSLLELAKMINPAATLLPAAAGGGLGTVDARISEIETKFMRAPQGTPEWQSYWKGEKMQAEYRQLLTARDQMKARQAAA